MLHTPIENIIPTSHERFYWGLEQALKFGNPQILSQILHAYLIPIPIKPRMPGNICHMQQRVEILPLNAEDKNFAMIIIADVTEFVIQKYALMDLGRRYEENSYHDLLTNLYNRRFMQDWLDRHFKQAKREKFTIAACLYDLDYFKEINDRHGHEIGDEVLQDLTKLIYKELRASDILIRYGGEEFLVLLPRTNLSEAMIQSERVRVKIEKTSIGTLAPGQITASIGVSVWDPQTPIDQETLLNNADKALYNAKHAGRNCVRS